jgi:hypothetical protein
VATNPKPKELPGSLKFGWSFIDGIPILYLVLGVVLIVGSSYYWIRRAQIPTPVVTDTAAAEAS